MTRIVVVGVAFAFLRCGSEREPGTLEQALQVCPAGSTVPGVDVSGWQGTVNWGQVAGAGYKFGYAKATQGNYFQEPTFQPNWSGMSANGMLPGAYHWLDGTISGTVQADYFLAYVGSLGASNLPPMLDWECNAASCGNAGAVSNAQDIQAASDFIAEIQAKTGLPTLIYTDSGFWSSVGAPSQFAASLLWVANWGPTCPNLPSTWSSWAFWQSTDVGSVPGINGNVDLDEFNGTLAQLQTLGSGSGVSCSTYACGATYYWTCGPDGNLHSCDATGKPLTTTCAGAGCHTTGTCTNDVCNANCSAYACGTTYYWTCGSDGDLHSCDGSGNATTQSCNGVGCHTTGTCTNDVCNAVQPDAGAPPDASGWIDAGSMEADAAVDAGQIAPPDASSNGVDAAIADASRATNESDAATSSARWPDAAVSTAGGNESGCGCGGQAGAGMGCSILVPLGAAFRRRSRR